MTNLEKNLTKCPHCGHPEVWKFGRRREGTVRTRYRCAKCKRDFTDVSRTIFSHYKLPSETIDRMIYMVGKYDLTSPELHRMFRVTKVSAYRLLKKIKAYEKENKSGD